MKCAVERGADEEDEEGRGWRGSCWGIESVSMLIALVWRGWWTEDSTSALIQAHFPRSQLLDSQLSPPKNPERLWIELWGSDAVFCCCGAFISNWCVLISCKADLGWSELSYFHDSTCARVVYVFITRAVRTSQTPGCCWKMASFIVFFT